MVRSRRIGRSAWWIACSIAVVLLANFAAAQEERSADVLRGSITAEREWWDLRHYRLQVTFQPETKSLHGSNEIRFKTLKPGQRMQIDLQEPLSIQSVTHDGHALSFERTGNVYWIDFSKPLPAGEIHTLTVNYGGVPRESKNPPWEGGVSWKQDKNGKPFIATTCQGIGASIWWPNKDHGYDEPDEGMEILATVPASLTAVSNGRLIETQVDKESRTRTFVWRVTQPINNYCVNINVGDYVNYSDVYQGEAGPLTMDYWVLSYQLKVAQKHFKEAPRVIQAFEHWFGKYPFYEDSYKLVEVPYLGMEHQSSVTYGNGFQNGYRGSDLSKTGVGMKFDFIIVHESGHEWFGNNVSMKDVADMWIHEGFTNYSENLFVDYHFSKEEAQDYVIGCRRLVRNDQPIIGEYGKNQSGSGDMYYKGGNMLHTIRHIIDDDEKWRQILRGLNETFWHSTVTTEQVENYIISESGVDLSSYFDQYLRTKDIPVLNYSIEGQELTYYFDQAVENLTFPVRIHVNGKPHWLRPTPQPQSLTLDESIESFEIDRNFYVLSQNIDVE
jgi:aminopeptidase N